MFCLPKIQADKFIQAIKAGDIDPAQLAELDSAERRASFEKIVGAEEAKQVNALFESKLLLRNQQLGMINWARTVTGLKDPLRRDLIARIQKLERVLTPSDERAFLKDFAAKKLGTEITFDEARKVAELAADVSTTAAAVTKDTPRGSPERLAWGHAQLDLHDYVESLKGIDKRFIQNVANIPKTAMSTLDLSAALRQGWGMIGRPQWYSAVASMLKYAASEGAYRTLQADIVSAPTYEVMKHSGLRISILADKLSQREEQFMSTLINRVPGVRPSERAYVGFLNKLRADVFDHLLQAAEARGEDVQVGAQATKDIANVINDFTGSGNLGKGDKYANAVPILNATFFSPRKISATINMLNPIRYASPSVSPTARIAAIRQLVGSTAITISVLALARLAGAKVETNPDSADFGKAVFGKTHYDFTGGNGSYAVLLARLATNQTKSTTSGKTTELGKGYKPTTRGSLIVGEHSFFRNKLSPLGSLIADWAYGSDTNGNPFNLPKALTSRAIPLITQDVYQIEQNDPSNTFGATAASLFGVGVQQY